jgi:hypothetical protein
VAHRIERITHPDIRPAFARYSLAVKSAGLVFLSGVRAGMAAAAPRRFDELPSAGRVKRQGYTLVDQLEGVVSGESWSAHESLEAVLKAAATRGDQLLRQHIWQRESATSSWPSWGETPVGDAACLCHRWRHRR